MRYWLNRTLAFGLTLSAGISLPLSIHAAAVVNVTLQDESNGVSLRGMEVTGTPGDVSAGQVTIFVTNRSQSLIHEVIVVRTDGTNKPLPYDAKTDRVIESRVQRLGEVADLQPGKSGRLTLTLIPGLYLLLCNQPGHYKAGMWTKLTVNR
jgi:uncharacterized cupredoxin-like copper-binding protein